MFESIVGLSALGVGMGINMSILLKVMHLTITLKTKVLSLGSLLNHLLSFLTQQ